jgi:RimJ/RimL family protein N-acetyltransferase
VELDPLGLTSAAFPAAATIQTDRLRLDSLRVADAQVLAEVLGDDRLHEFTGGRPPTVDELRSHYAHLVDGSGRPDEIWLNWVVRRETDGGAIGTVQATVHVRDGRHRASVAWIIGTEWQRQGFGSEAARALVDWLTASGADEIVAYVHPDHEASARVAARAGLESTPELFDGERVWRLKTEGASRRPRR